MSKDDGGSAFPTFSTAEGYLGMSLRDYFAAKAMQADIANCGADNIHEKYLAKWAYKMADCMLAERSKP